jgi:hypothetical protein
VRSEALRLRQLTFRCDYRLCGRPELVGRHAVSGANLGKRRACCGPGCRPHLPVGRRRRSEIDAVIGGFLAPSFTADITPLTLGHHALTLRGLNKVACTRAQWRSRRKLAVPITQGYCVSCPDI